MSRKSLHIGVDVGSTTVKTVVLDSVTKELLYHKYMRHNARQAKTLAKMLEEIHNNFKEYQFQVAVCGSGGRDIAASINAHFIQEVVANSLAVQNLYPDSRVAIELGGQDAKIIFFYYEEMTNKLMASDMRMNGTCAGGTGAFIDEIAALINIPVENFNEAAAKGSHVYDISGRCGVFAKTDIQPLLNQGVSKEDLALSTFHAIAKQTIGGLAQGLEIKAPIIFEGGPLTFNPVLIEVFAERLGLQKADIITPQHPEVLVAIGTAYSLDLMFKEDAQFFDMENAIHILEDYLKRGQKLEQKRKDVPFFQNQEEETHYRQIHKLPPKPEPDFPQGTELRVYLGIDAGSTTTKFVFLDENGNLVDSSYHSNSGDPLKILQDALLAMYDKYRKKDVTLKILGAGATGYGELLFAKAFQTDHHMVETVAHAEAAMQYSKDVSFILDIGGQDMKAIQIENGIVTGITLNEACSAGCGSFLEGFASSLGIHVNNIASMAFQSENPSLLGSRCTVFMNSSIITEQKNGKTPEDIMAGLCRSIIENVFTKVIRTSNLASLGDTIIVQGGTFKNDAVLRALEQFSGKKVIRPPFPGEMGAIGIALLTKKHMEDLRKRSKHEIHSQFITEDDLRIFSYTKQSNSVCPFCTNNCNRTIIKFYNGDSFITGNRCEKGEIIGDIHDNHIKERLKEATQKQESVPDLFKYRETLIFQNYDYSQLCQKRNHRIGIPQVLEFWSSMPFWSTFFKALGFDPVYSDRSTRKIYESGLASVPSDTVCFPAKLAHGHVLNLLQKKKVDSIFMPIMGRMPSENPSVISDFTCSVLKGYPIIIRNSDEPEKKYNTPFLTPYFPWFDYRSRDLQIIRFMEDTFQVPRKLVKKAIAMGDKATESFYHQLQTRGSEVLQHLDEHNIFGVVLGGRPYHTDHIVNHDLSSYFTKQGIPVLTIDSLPQIHEEELHKVRMDAVVNFHVRMISGAMFTARQSKLEFVQIVSFGCGHDAVISDEIMDVMKKISAKNPLILKLDESDVVGPLNVRIKSFIETVSARRKLNQHHFVRPLPDPFPVKYEKKDRKRILLIPNASVSFCKLSSAILSSFGFQAEPLPLIDEEGIKLAKKYTHNDVCYPAQINIGEFLMAMKRGDYDPDNVALAMGKITCDCRLSHYAVLARQAMDEAGYSQVPIITNAIDKKLHPDAKLGPSFEYLMVWGIVMFDILEGIVRRIRPYEKISGETMQVFNAALDTICTGFRKNRKLAMQAFQKAIQMFSEIDYDTSYRKPRVFVIGEYLLNFHPISNNNIEDYLESHGMEVVFPYMVDAFRKDYVRRKSERRDFFVRFSFAETLLNDVSDIVVQMALNKLGKIAEACPAYHKKHTLYEMAPKSDHIIHHSYTSGEGWLIPGEIYDHAEEGVNSFVIVQPFGCLPNHITGRGLIKRIKEDLPHIQILSLDYDPDTSTANIENRLQMLIINAKELEKTHHV